MDKQIIIIKASGEKQVFSEEKLRDSLKRSGANTEATNIVIEKIRNELKEGMTTKQIYNKAFSLLKKDKSVAVRYSLRQAVMALGPTGFPFEKFLGEILKTQGYSITNWG